MLDNFKIIKSLGHGCSSKVFLVEDDCGQKYAAKVIRKDKKYSQAFSAGLLKGEFHKLMKFEHHPNFIRAYQVNLEGTFISGSTGYTVMYNLMEYAQNNTISDYIRYTGPVEEEIARFWMGQLVYAVSSMHHQNIAHGDIKLENILLDEFYNIKLADLGTSLELVKTKGFTSLRRGTRFYLPPEVEKSDENSPYNAMEADVYTLGVTLFLLLTGEFPTRQLIDEDGWSTSTTDDATEKDIPLDIYIKSKWYDFSDDLKELLQKMLSSYPSERPTIDEVIKSPWLSMPFNEELPYMVYEEMSARSSHKGSLSN